jgi:hypothetical protein
LIGPQRLGSVSYHLKHVFLIWIYVFQHNCRYRLRFPWGFILVFQWTTLSTVSLTHFVFKNNLWTLCNRVLYTRNSKIQNPCICPQIWCLVHIVMWINAWCFFGLILPNLCFHTWQLSTKAMTSSSITQGKSLNPYFL